MLTLPVWEAFYTVLYSPKITLMTSPGVFSQIFKSSSRATKDLIKLFPEAELYFPVVLQVNWSAYIKSLERSFKVQICKLFILEAFVFLIKCHYLLLWFWRLLARGPLKWVNVHVWLPMTCELSTQGVVLFSSLIVPKWSHAVFQQYNIQQ